MDSAKQQLVEKLKDANNVLVTVSRDPSVDQLSALLGLSLLLNKQGKHSAAVFSGHIPSTLEFLKPEETFEKNTDSLRDFIIALDKNKADKLRYKVEDNIVRIFITPYKTSISQEDLEFSQGDFNVDLVVALGVKKQEDLDEAIMAHGRILHDATMASINVSSDGGLGSINWREASASSLSELVTELALALNSDALDEQIANALLTGIVSETDRFSNEKTSSQTMGLAADLMAAGANQQLVATKLEEPVKEPETNKTDVAADIKDEEPEDKPKNDAGTLQIEHTNSDNNSPKPSDDSEDKSPELVLPVPYPDNEEPEAEKAEPPITTLQGPKLVTEPPTLGGTLTANSSQPKLDPVTDPFSLPTSEPPQLLERKPDTISPLVPYPDDESDSPTPSPPLTSPLPSLTPPPSGWTPPAPSPIPPPSPPIAAPPKPSVDDNGTLTELEQAVKSSHLENGPSADTARDAVNKALNEQTDNLPPSPIAALNAQPLGPDLHPMPTPPPPPPPVSDSQKAGASSPPPVPPPIPFDFGKPTNP